MSGVNLVENGDFESANGDSPIYWRGFGNSEVSIHPTENFNGKNCCITSKRAKNSYGPCQNVLYSVKLGCKYKFNAYVKLDPDLPESSTENIRVQLQYQLTNNMKNAWIRIASADATLNKWTQITGVLIMPGDDNGNLLSAFLYFGGPPPDVNFMVADVELFIHEEDDDDETENLLQNPDFSVSTNGHPHFWYGFGKAKVYVHPEEKFDGKNHVCVSTERKESYGGLGQNLLNFVSLGHRYKFSANLRLHPDMPANEKHNINVKLQYRLATDASFRYLFIATASGVSSEDWVQVKGRVNMPPDIPGNQLITAILYFGNAPTEVSFMVAKTRLSSLDPPATIVEKLSIKSLSLSRECSDVTTGAPVFISYQWDIQDKVKRLRDKLEKCGISCWMDIGQMGGGDSLYSEIDKGMRTAKVIISCVTRKYTMSENCQREATLADCLKKPIIPVIFDNELQWPPPGQMSMIFAKLLYINVCSEDKDEIPPMKFQELLSEIKERIDI